MNLVTRRHDDGHRASEAVYSACNRYRYSLTRIWNRDDRRLLYIMLNPSTATERANDPTVERCERRARMLGYGGFRVCNLFALRETDPSRLKRAAIPEGPDNRDQILAGIGWADDILCAWAFTAHIADRDVRCSNSSSRRRSPCLPLARPVPDTPASTLCPLTVKAQAVARTCRLRIGASRQSSPFRCGRMGHGIRGDLATLASRKPLSFHRGADYMRASDLHGPCWTTSRLVP